MTDDKPSPDAPLAAETEDIPHRPPPDETGESAAMERMLAGTLFLVGSVLAAFALWQAQREPAAREDWPTWLLLVAGIGLAAAGVTRSHRPAESSRVGRAALRLATWLGVQPWQLACLVCAPLLAWIAARAAGGEAFMVLPWLAVGGWMGAIGLAIAGGWRTRPVPAGEGDGLHRRKVPWGVILLFLAFTAAAFAVRAVATSHIPSVLTGDEGSSGLSAVEFVKGQTNNIFRTGWFSFPSFFYFLQSLPIRALGQTIPALRLLAALGGALTVGCVYLLGRYLFGNWVGIFSGIFLLAYNYHNHFSRIGLNNIWDGLWFVLVLGLWIHGWREQRRASFLWAGLCLGLAQYFYVTGRVLAALPLAFCLLALWFDRRRLKANLASILLMSLVFLATYLPLAMFYLHNPGEFTAPLNRVSIFGLWMADEIAFTGLPAWQIVLRQVGLSLQGFVLIPIQMWYQPETPLLRPIPAVLFLIGMVILALRIKDSRSILLWLWVLVFGVVGGLSESAPAAQRYVAVAPALALVIGFGLQESAAALSGLWPSRTEPPDPEQKRRLTGWIVLPVVLLLGLNELHFYYFNYTPRSDWGLNNQVAQQLADTLQEKEPGWQVAFFGFPRMGYYSHSSVPYLNPHVNGFDFIQPWGAPDNPALTGERILFVVLPEHASELEQIIQAYPGGRLAVEQNAAGQMLYWGYEVDR